MNTCALTRLLVPGFIVGMIVSSVAGSDPLGFVAAAATMAALIVVQRVRGTATACAVRLPEKPEHDENLSRTGADRAPESAGELTDTAEAR